MRARAQLVGATLAVAALFGSARAEAAIVDVTKVTAATNDTQRPKNALYDISYQDCLDNVEFTFAISVNGSTSGFQIWASETLDCKQSINRQDDDSGCTLLASSYPTATGKFIIKAKELVKSLSNIDKATCADSSSASAARQLKLYFMVTGSDDPIPDENVYVWDQTHVDLLGPAPPSASELVVDPADGLLLLTLPMNTDGDKLGYYIFCDPNPNAPSGSVDECADAGTGGTGTITTSSTTTTKTTGGTGGANTGDAGTGGAGTGGASGGTGGTGTGGTGGTGGTSSTGGTGGTSSTGGTGGTGGTSETSTSACSGGETLGCVDKNHPSIHSSSVCGARIPASATGPSIKKLENGQPYVIAVAAYDTVNNIGPLSVLQCATPKATRTFFNQYCADGGVACAEGCGTCNVGSGSDLTWPGLGVMALAGAVFVARRDEKRRRKARAARGAR